MIWQFPSRCSQSAVLLPALSQALPAEGTLAAPPQIPYDSPPSNADARLVAATALTEAHKHGWNMAIAIVDPWGFLGYF